VRHRKTLPKDKSHNKTKNFESIAFHKSIGMELTGNGAINGIPVVFDYSGPGEHRVVFMKDV